MGLDTLDKRYDLVKEMIDEAFAFEESVANLEDDNDWGGAMTLLDDLAALEDMICAEEIFLNACDEMGEVRTRDRDEQEEMIGIFYMDGLNVFNQEVLLPRLKHALKTLNGWGFRTERGVEFQEKASKNLAALLKKYDGLYDV